MADFVDPQARIEALIATVAERFRRRFIQTLAQIQDRNTLLEIKRLLSAGNISAALAEVELASIAVGGLYSEAFVYSGDEAARFIADKLNVLVTFDRVNARAVAKMQANQLRLVTGFTAQQTAATRAALLSGIERGINPLDMAREFRSSIGLTPNQVQIVNNYRRALEGRSANALERQLRDRRFDPTVRRAVEGGRPLSADQIDRMVDRYRERWVQYRSRVIARTEALRSVHEGTQEMYQQAIDNGRLERDSVIQTWKTSGRSNVRDSHSAMEGQQVPVGEPFISGLGNPLMFPGDPAAPAEDSIQCVCAVTTRFREDAARAVPA